MDSTQCHMDFGLYEMVPGLRSFRFYRRRVDLQDQCSGLMWKTGSSVNVARDQADDARKQRDLRFILLKIRDNGLGCFLARLSHFKKKFNISYDHLVYHFVLTYSNWETGTICFPRSGSVQMVLTNEFQIYF